MLAFLCDLRLDAAVLYTQKNDYDKPSSRPERRGAGLTNSTGISLASKLSNRPQISRARPKTWLGHNPKQGYPSHTPWLLSLTTDTIVLRDCQPNLGQDLPQGSPMARDHIDKIPST